MGTKQRRAAYPLQSTGQPAIFGDPEKVPLKIRGFVDIISDKSKRTGCRRLSLGLNL
jgi:hypothetical protein